MDQCPLFSDPGDARQRCNLTDAFFEQRCAGALISNEVGADKNCGTLGSWNEGGWGGSPGIAGNDVDTFITAGTKKKMPQSMVHIIMIPESIRYEPTCCPPKFSRM